MNIADLLTGSAAHFTDKPLLRHDGNDVSHAALCAAVDAMAAHFRALGLARGDRLLILAHNRPAWLAALFAALRLGAIAVPVNPALTAPEIGTIIAHSDPAIVAVDAALRNLLCGTARFHIVDLAKIPPTPLGDTHVATTSANDPAIMFYTSGTTGRPKGALLGHGAEIFTARMVADHFGIGPRDISLIASPLSFIYPLVIDALASIHAGATIVLMERFHPGHVLRAIARERATIFMGVPTMYTMMIEWGMIEWGMIDRGMIDRGMIERGEASQLDLSSLRFCISAGQNIAWSVITRFKDCFGVPVYDLWGQTEGTPITSYQPSEEPAGRPESCGRALPGCAVRVIDDDGQDVPPETVGEVLLTGPNVMLGYHQNPQATADTLRNGWIHTGDLGRLDADGYLYIVGRKRDLIIRGGANIYPSEVEEAVYAHPAVSECAVIGLPDARYGERVSAFVVLRPGATASAAELRDHCRTRLADYKTPAEFNFLEDLPKGPTGKILKRSLREQTG